MDPNANDHGGMDTDSDLKILSMDSATLKSVVKSELLASGLTCHVMAEQVLGFLAKECVLKCLEVEDLCQRFDLKSYYCSIHGTKLESQVERRRGLENMAGTDDDQGENADQIGNNDNVAAEVNIECEDCVEAEFDRERCNYCEQFENMDELHQCNKCSYQECGPCFEGNSMDYCNSCEEMYCGREGCETFENCDCGEGFCSVCKEENFRACLRCGTNGCIDCFYDFGFRCNQCDKTFCHDCQDNGYCERCEHTFCSACKEIWYCGCDHGSCYDCDEPVKCEVCNQQHGCSDCSYGTCFCCGGCAKTFCREKCKEFTSCEICYKDYCKECDNGWFCSPCREYHCSAHGKYFDCQECGKGSHGEKFQCAECETVSCHRCSKVYACPECSKEICADCQDVFEICCCKGKGKFAFKKRN